ncbi:hypothetical protein B0H10DRAFT_2192633 [Mycena sp. CBHHK59/15]|nr:hypothetical protein B0H10DRAFT_2192633 [Mycena sp. CBHHK59/15]
MFWPWLGLKAMALAWLRLALASKNWWPGQKPSQAKLWLWPESQKAMAFGWYLGRFLALARRNLRPGQEPTQARVLAWLWPWYQSQKAMAFWPEAKARTSLLFAQICIWDRVLRVGHLRPELCRGTRKRDINKFVQSLAAEKADDDGNPCIEGAKTSRAKAPRVKGVPEAVCDQEDDDFRLPDLVDP